MGGTKRDDGKSHGANLTEKGGNTRSKVHQKAQSLGQREYEGWLHREKQSKVGNKVRGFG